MRYYYTWADARSEEAKEEDPFHFYASSVATWIVRESIEEVLDFMKTEGLTFSVFKVKLPLDALYEINYYIPKVKDDDLEYLGTWEI